MSKRSIQNRNFVAADMNNRFKSKRFNNDRTNRRANDARNNDLRSFTVTEVDEDFSDDDFQNYLDEKNEFVEEYEYGNRD